PASGLRQELLVREAVDQSAETTPHRREGQHLVVRELIAPCIGAEITFADLGHGVLRGSRQRVIGPAILPGDSLQDPRNHPGVVLGLVQNPGTRAGLVVSDQLGVDPLVSPAVTESLLVRGLVVVPSRIASSTRVAIRNRAARHARLRRKAPAMAPAAHML